MRRLLLTTLLLAVALPSCSDEPPPQAQPSTSSAPSGATSPQPAPSPQPALSGIASSAAVPLPTPDLTRRLTGNGIDLPPGVVAFGDTLTQASPALLRFLGRPSRDTGTVRPVGDYGACPGDALRIVEYDGGALELLFVTRGTAKEVFRGWALTGQNSTLPPARALVGDSTTLDISVSTTVREMRAVAGDLLEVGGDELVGPYFRLRDQSGGLSGTLTTAGPDGEVTLVRAGEACGE